MSFEVAAAPAFHPNRLNLCTVQSATLMGLSAETVTVEVACCRGPAYFQLVGLAQTPVREARVRVSSALGRLGLLLEEWAITVNLAPADLHKRDAALDLPIAMGVLGAVGRIAPSAAADQLFVGELSLNGHLQPVRGVLPMLLGARARGLTSAIVPVASLAEAELVDDFVVYGAETLEQVLEHVSGKRKLQRIKASTYVALPAPCGPDLLEVQGQATAKRALEIAAAGGHNVLMVGPPGAGKTMLARRLPSILPPMEHDEALECTAVHSVAGLIAPEKGALCSRPFRAPHHSITEQGLVGGGELPRPGEISLAHNGVLFLDELPEFRRGVLESLRQPLEDGEVCIARARGRASFPARPILIGAMNPCPCGYYGHPTRRCICSEKHRQRYRTRISGPLLDRLDVHVLLPPVEVQALAKRQATESSQAVRERVVAARTIQLERRRAGKTQARSNAQLNASDVAAILKPTSRALRLLERATRQFGLSARAFGKLLRVARTIADLEAAQNIGEAHVAEALQGRLSALGKLVG